jgi:hypothetical protein
MKILDFALSPILFIVDKHKVEVVSKPLIRFKGKAQSATLSGG